MSKVYLATKADLSNLAGCKAASGVCTITSVSTVVSSSPRVVVYSGKGSVNTGFTRLRLMLKHLIGLPLEYRRNV